MVEISQTSNEHILYAIRYAHVIDVLYQAYEFMVISRHLIAHIVPFTGTGTVLRLIRLLGTTFGEIWIKKQNTTLSENASKCRLQNLAILVRPQCVNWNQTVQKFLCAYLRRQIPSALFYHYDMTLSPFSLLAIGSAAFIWNLCCHWLKGLRQRQLAVTAQGPAYLV